MEEGEYQLEEGEELTNNEERNGADDINSPENNCFLNVSEEEQAKHDESIEIGNELDFEEGEKESGEEGEDFDDDDPKPATVTEFKEDGELSEEDEEDPSLRQEPKTVCRFFNKGQCTWGTNCRFLHPGVSDKGNYNMFAPPKQPSHAESADDSVEKERPREVRPFLQEPSFESAWERGLRHAKEMMKRASKRKETDADFEEKRFNLSLGQAELDRENDYYTRPASPVHKQVDVEYPDPYERQAIRHFRGGHIENIEVRYTVEPAYAARGGHMRSRREKFDREVTERMPRRMRPPPSPPVPDHPHPRIIKEKRYPRPKTWSDDKAQPPPGAVKEEGKQEAETWADPWARRRSPSKGSKRKEQQPRPRRSYSTGSSSRSSRSSRSSSYSSYSGSSSRSSRSRSSSRSITPPVHPRQRALANRGRGGRAGARGAGPPIMGRGGRYPNQSTEQFARPPIHRRPEGDMKDNKVFRVPDMKGQMARPPRERPQPPRPENRPPPPIAQRLPPRKTDPRLAPESNERVDMFGRTIRKEPQLSPPRSISPPAKRGGRKISVSRSRSKSFSGASRSSSSSSSVSSPSPAPRRKDHRVKMTEGTVSYGESMKKNKMADSAKAPTQKPQQSKLLLRKQVPNRRGRPIVPVDDDSGESDTGGGGRLLKKRKADLIDIDEAPPAKISKQQDSAQMLRAAIAKKPVGRREELLKQLRAVEDAIARKRGKPII